MYDGDGRMAVQFGRRGRAPFASAEMRGGTAEEMKAAFHGYVAYFGTYAVDEAAGTVTHAVEGSLFPNWEGQAQVRHYRLEGNRLTLTTPPLPAAGGMVTLVLEWEREDREAGTPAARREEMTTMSSVTVDLGAATGTQPPVEWPDRCTCCGKPSPGSHGALTHTILSVSNTAPGTVLAEPIHDALAGANLPRLP